MGQISATYLTTSRFCITADHCFPGRKGDFSGSALSQFWSGYFVAVTELMLGIIRIGEGQLGLVFQKMNEVCFGHAYLDQRGIPFVLLMEGEFASPWSF
jgi:hypothetical protein